MTSANSALSPHTSREPESDISAFDPQPEVFFEFATVSIGGESDTESLTRSELVEEVLVERPLKFRRPAAPDHSSIPLLSGGQFDDDL